jgi:hypothetical protein
MTSQSPRDSRNVVSCRRVRRLLERNAETSARRMNVGAQKCVIQRVKKYAGVVRSRSVGSNVAPLKKSRT